MIVITDTLFDRRVCESLIKYFLSQKDTGNIRYPKGKGNIAFDIDKNNTTFKKIYNILETQVSKVYDMQLEVDWGQLTEWYPGTKLYEHFDHASKDTIMTSVTYLNDSYSGGETYLVDLLEVSPQSGRTIFFNGSNYKHGVKEINTGIRYVMPVWYKIKR